MPNGNLISSAGTSKRILLLERQSTSTDTDLVSSARLLCLRPGLLCVSGRGLSRLVKVGLDGGLQLAHAGSQLVPGAFPLVFVFVPNAHAVQKETTVLVLHPLQVAVDRCVDLVAVLFEDRKSRVVDRLRLLEVEV